MYKEFSSNQQPTADELAIQNMLTALGYGLFNDEEKEYIKKAIKAHILMNAQRILDTFYVEKEDSTDKSNKVR